jgi:D-alanyl-D-alanine carboxypeptidase
MMEEFIEEEKSVRKLPRKLPLFFILFLIIIQAAILYCVYVFKEGPDIYAKSYILVDAETNQILAGTNMDKPLAAASMSKLMTEYLVLKHIHEGKLHWDDQVILSDKTAFSDGVKLNIEPGTSLSVRDLFNSMAVASANNAAVALAEKIAGSEEEFTKLMNSQAEELGLSKQTRFFNATGLPTIHNEESTMTAKDVAILADHLIQSYPEILETTKQSVYQLGYDGSVVFTTNKMLHENDASLSFKGMDGLKTGFTDQAGYCFTGTAKHGDKRLITVVMGTEDTDARFVETRKLLSYGFQKSFVIQLQSTAKSLFNKDEQIYTVEN